MFAPDVPTAEVSFTAPGLLADGRTIELTESTLASLGRQHGFGYSRWHRLRNNLSADAPALLAALGRFTCAQNRPDTGRPALRASSCTPMSRSPYPRDPLQPGPPGVQIRLRQSCWPDQR